MRGAWLAFVATFAVSCQNTDGVISTASDGGTDGATTSGTDAGLGAFVDAFCATVRSCCAAAGLTSDRLAMCEPEVRRQVPFLGFADKGTVLVDNAKLARCVAALGEQSRSCAPPLSLCREAFSPTLAVGEKCDRGDECVADAAHPASCIRTGVTADSGTMPGTCLALPAGKSGDACFGSCSRGVNCSFTTYTTYETNPPLNLCHEEDEIYCDATAHCAPRIADGAPCTSGCASTSYCDVVCKPRKHEGQPCTATVECEAGFRCLIAVCAVAPFASAKLCNGDYN